MALTMSQLRPESHWLQIKEKFGGLRLYFAGGNARIDIISPKGERVEVVQNGGRNPLETFSAHIRALEETSLKTCCLCGGKNGSGELVEINRWLMTACPTCEALIRDHRAQPKGG